MAKVSNTGYAQVYDSGPVIDKMVEQNANSQKQYQAEISRVVKERDAILKGLDSNISKIQFKRGEELRAKKDEAMAEANRIYSEEGINERSHAKVKKIQEELDQKIGLAEEQQDYLKASRRLAEGKSDKIIDKDGTFNSLKEYEQMGIDEASEFDGSIIKYKGENLNDMLRDFAKDNPRNRDLSPEQREDNLVKRIDTPNGQKLFEEGLGQTWDTPEEFRDYMRLQDIYGYNQAQKRASKDAYFSFNQDGSLKEGGNPNVKAYWVDQVKNSGTFSMNKNGQDIKVTKSLMHPNRPSTTVSGLEIEDADGNKRKVDLRGRFLGYVTTDGGKMYAQYDEVKKAGFLGGSSTSKIVWSPLDTEEAIQREKSYRGALFDAFIQGSKATSSQESEFNSLYQGINTPATTSTTEEDEEETPYSDEDFEGF